MTQKKPTNPFHPEAVATYGLVTTTCENMDYMHIAEEELNQYLIDYPKSEKRYGAAIGLRGEYGSGKTHLLTWLSQKAREMKSTNPIVIYAEADRASFFDLYTQLLSQLSREKLQQILSEALQKLAKEQVGKFKVTESIGDRIKGSEDLLVLNKEKNIDLGQLLIQLRNKLKDPDKPNEIIPGVIPQMLTLIDDPSLGDIAYQWLLGNEIIDLKALGLNHHLRQQEQQGSVQPDITAVNVLETIAALFRIAQRPLIILIDQLEHLLNADEERLANLFSVIKKMIEQLNRQKVLTFIAGVDDQSWNKFPRDVTARLRSREPLQVGNLSLDETKSLLESYTQDLPSQFNSDAIKKIHLLSGGNPREIIRIAYYAYEDKEIEGKLNKVNENILIESAKKSGTIADINRLVLKLTDPILNEFGNKVQENYDVGENVSLERLLLNDDQPRLALMTLKATDKLSEINSAKKFTVVREYLETKYSSTPLITVAVGYSSEEIRNLLGEAASVLQFDKQTFVSKLKTKVTELLAQQSRGAKKNSDPDIQKVLEKISRRLESLELERTNEIKKIFERFAEKMGLQSEELRKERELRSRTELLDSLDELQNSLNEEGIVREREVITSILVANESYLKIKQFDYLGDLYRELLAEAFNLQDAEKVCELTNYRKDIIRELRRLLRDKGIMDHLVERSLLFSVIISLIFGLFESIFLIQLNYDQLTKMSGMEFYLWSVTKPPILVLISTSVIFILTYSLVWLNKDKWKTIEKRVRSSSS